jgi:hypothetical protein
VRAENIGESGEKGTVMDWMRTGRRSDDDELRERIGVARKRNGFDRRLGLF